ncbi:MAG: hypothetical protein QXJ96_01325 [Candidatus Aenigmatarchaeota archaeon]|nr:hypothetical protein [Candidatus Aenigmarchaeota archaeon]
MKAQQEIITYILITAILIIVVSSAYIWGIGIIEKNRDVANLQNIEAFMKELNNKIKSVANTGGRESVKIDIPTFSFENGAITVFLETRATIYDPGKQIYFTKNPDCHITNSCILGRDEPEIFYVYSRKIEEKYYTTYYLSYRSLISLQDGNVYLIVLEGEKQMGKGEIIIENKGKVLEGNLIKTLIEIKLV